MKTISPKKELNMRISIRIRWSLRCLLTAVLPMASSIAAPLQDDVSSRRPATSDQ
ncbi:MAG UNVERIFIED_CONTAM: hypothetical protein LVR18_10900 [Planctomycetaceae bacterium]